MPWPGAFLLLCHSYSIQSMRTVEPNISIIPVLNRFRYAQAILRLRQYSWRSACRYSKY
jgi:hypothetical protein